MASLINPSNIDVTYPIAGQDNDTQGFRDNFNNIKNNLTTAKNEITDLQSAFSNSYGNANVSAHLTSGNISNISISGTISANTLTVTSAIQFANLTSAQVNTISTPARGMTVYNYTSGNIQVYNGTKWANITLS